MPVSQHCDSIFALVVSGLNDVLNSAGYTQPRGGIIQVKPLNLYKLESRLFPAQIPSDHAKQ